MPQVDVNYLAIIVAAIINLVLGFLWYGPLFGRRWMALAHVTPQQMGGGVAKITVGSFVVALVTGYQLVTLLIAGALLAVWA